MTFHLVLIGWLLVILAFIHVFFPGYFKWKDELSGLSLINRDMMRMHTFFIALIVLLMGLLCITSAEELQHNPLGRKIALGLGIFWFIRWLVQFFGYSSLNWKGKRFETSIHILFVLLWGYVSVVFLWVAGIIF